MEQTWIIVALIFATVFFAIEALYYTVFRAAREQRQINRRLALASGATRREEVLEQLRRERGLFGGDYSSINPLQRIVVQSGLRLNLWNVLSFFFLASFVSFLAIGLLIGFNPLTAIAAVLGSGLLLFAYLLIVRSRRIAKFGTQLPEAVDVMVRSLRAGHPIPVALALVGQEMADPAGSEFGIAADEITYGADLETAMDNLYQRVGQGDLLLVVISISIQAMTGGNLSEILSKLSHVIRERFKMRRKVRALSAEGRFSALALSLLPFIVFGMLNLVAPSFYGDIWDHPSVIPTLVFCGVIMAIGNYVTYRMVNFKY